MKWEKDGQIFQFEKSPFVGRFAGYAQSPQAIVFDDYVRIYFCTRIKDATGKYLSHVQYVDFNLSFSRVLNFSRGEVISLGRLGCFDEHGIFPFNPHNKGGQIVAYTTGWTRRKSVDVDSGIGLVISSDGGATFKRIGDGPVLSSSLYEPFLVCDGFVQYFEDMFHMYYIYGTQWQEPLSGGNPERTYVIGHAVSMDGINWIKEGRQIIPSAFPGECQALPTVLRMGARYHMYFCCRNSFDFRQNSLNSYRLGYAFSDDLKHWVRNDAIGGLERSASGWDSEMICYPHLFRCKNTIRILYNGNRFGKDGFGMATLISTEG